MLCNIAQYPRYTTSRLLCEFSVKYARMARQQEYICRGEPGSLVGARFHTRTRLCVVPNGKVRRQS
jgi:hypothetical protein